MEMRQESSNVKTHQANTPEIEETLRGQGFEELCESVHRHVFDLGAAPDLDELDLHDRQGDEASQGHDRNDIINAGTLDHEAPGVETEADEDDGEGDEHGIQG
jgi:hypothetical protein